MFLSASEAHNRANVNRSIEESLAGLERVLEQAREAGLRCEGVISVSFGCPYEGRVDPERVFAIARRLADAGAQEIGFGDTTGMANRRQVRRFFERARDVLGDVELTAHFHNTRGQGLANVFAALEIGDRLVRVELRRARRLSGAPGSDRQRRDRGRRLDAARDRGADRCRSARADRLQPRPAAASAAEGSAATRSLQVRSTGTTDVRARADRQPRRDRAPRHADLAPAGDRRDRRVRPGRPPCAARPRSRRGDADRLLPRRSRS